MLYSIKRFWLMLTLLVVGAPSVFGFSMLGPYDVFSAVWQIPALGFNLADDDGGPKDLGDGYRWNTRTLYYACDASYADFFGTNGIAQIDAAFAVFNSLSNLSSYTPSLSEWPLSTSRYNGTAVALNLLDVKSSCMSTIINMLGLAQPDRYIWNIHDRFLPTGGTCPFDEIYIVVQRNFDPVSDVYSSYINGTLYDYTIVEGCSTTPIVAVAAPFPVDLTALTPTAVASGVSGFQGHLQIYPGLFYSGLTRDDVGGLRYLMATNRMNVETVPTNVLQVANDPTPQLIVTSNLMLFNQQALTNNPAALLALYPGLLITSTNVGFTNVVTTNIFAVATNVTPSVAGAVTLVLVTNLTTNVQQVFFYTFGNLVIYTNGPQSLITTQTTQIIPRPLAPAGTLETNTISSTVLANITNGAFYIFTNLCGFTNIYVQLVNVVPITNQIPIFNPFGLTNTNALSASTVTFFTNYFLVGTPVDCFTPPPTLREGIDKINFVRVDFDSILGTNWGPVTNIYQLTAISNGAPVVQTFRRVVTRPDILIVAKDGINGPANPAPILSPLPGLLNFNSSAVSSDGNGPGTIEPPVQFLFSKGGGPIYFNLGGFFIQSEATALSQSALGSIYYQWASFDGSTNDPVVYPSGTSLAGLEQLVFFQISTTNLPAYSVSGNSVGNPYSATLQAFGGTQPYQWSLATGSPALPPGLTLSASGVISGVTSASAGATFDFVAQVTDAGNRVTQESLFLTINP